MRDVKATTKPSKRAHCAPVFLFHTKICYNTYRFKKTILKAAIMSPIAPEDSKKTKISTEPYKGVRDFYPEDMAVQNHIFNVWKSVAERFGYEQYDASILEPAELYRAKSGEEIVNEQTYIFTDRGDREIALRPEMTPTVARMVAAHKRELAFPLRWYSIPNLFRYEQPQRGRLREHWQLNVDIFGIDNTHAEVEVITIATEIMHTYGFTDADFEIRLNHRKIMNYVLHDLFKLSENDAHRISKLIDKKRKISETEFADGVAEILGEKSQDFITLLSSNNFEEFIQNIHLNTREEHEGIKEIKAVMQALTDLGITNIRFDQTLMRGFDYYTGTVFEIFDTNPANRRSVFGGGRYDDLLALFGGEKVPAVGFGCGDVTMRDLLETYKLIPPYHSPTLVALLPMESAYIPYANKIATLLRQTEKQGDNPVSISVAVDYTDKKIGDKIKSADKHKIPYIIVIGEQEQKTGTMKLKHLKTGEESTCDETELKKQLKKILSDLCAR